MWKILGYYLLAVNVLTFFYYGLDKMKARKLKWRIPESDLILLALIGGSLGAWCGMKLWHHKTGHAKFRYGVPAILAVQLCLIIYLVCTL